MNQKQFFQLKQRQLLPLRLLLFFHLVRRIKNTSFKMKNAPLSITELFLIEAILYIGLWLWNEYIATIMTLSFCAIAFFILAISLISELIERSKVPRWYFSYMVISILTPLVIGAFFYVLNKGSFGWMKGI